MKVIKQIFGQIHLWLGLISGLVVVVVAFTGCLYVFEDEARAVFQHKYFYVENPTTERKNLLEISKAVKVAFPKEKITQIRFNADANAAFLYHTKSQKAISINPYTLHIQGIRDLKSDFFKFILDIHLNLQIGEVGEQIIKWNVLIFFVLCISGLITWLPKQKKYLKQALTIKWKTRNWKRLNWDLHSVLGFYGLFVMVIISLTGIFWTFDTAKMIVSKATGNKITNTKAPKNISNDSTKVYSMEAVYFLAKQRHSGERQTFISNSDKPDQPLRVLFRYPYSIVRRQNTLFYDKFSGELLREDLYKNYNNYDKVMRSNYDFHTGKIPMFGIGSKIVYFLASLFAASLPITGFLVWWGKRYKKTLNQIMTTKDNQVTKIQS